MKEFLINERKVFLLTTRELVKVTGFTSRTLRKWSKIGIMPSPVTEEERSHPVLGDIKSRFYLVEQAEVLVWWLSIAKPRNGLHVSEDMKNLLHDKWAEATNKFLKNY